MTFLSGGTPSAPKAETQRSVTLGKSHWTAAKSRFTLDWLVIDRALKNI